MIDLACMLTAPWLLAHASRGASQPALAFVPWPPRHHATALLLLLADTIARSLGVPVGVITALIGAPFLLWLLHRARTGYAL